MSRAVANTLLPAARPASTIARPRPRELPVTNDPCAIHPPLSSHPPDILEKLLKLRIGCAMGIRKDLRQLIDRIVRIPFRNVVQIVGLRGPVAAEIVAVAGSDERSRVSGRCLAHWNWSQRCSQRIIWKVLQICRTLAFGLPPQQVAGPTIW